MEELLSKLDRPEDSRKGENGYLGIIGGSVDYTGAPALVAEAALRAGCDLTRILTASRSRDVVASFSENLVVDTYESDYFGRNAVEKARDLEEWSDAAVVGPGLGDVDDGAVEEFVSGAEVPLVIDADAIEPALGADINRAVLTPHSGEAGVISDRFGSVKDFVEEKQVVTVVKGPTDRIYSPGELFENSSGTADMTVGGTGDVLAGIIGSLLSQGLELEDAAQLGSWISGKAGEKAAEKHGSGMVATDVVERIPEFVD